MRTYFFARHMGLTALALALPLAAAAQGAYTLETTRMRAGPGTDYPVVARLESDVNVNVVGCTEGYGWCDITLPDGLRGWVRGDRLEYAYAGNNMPIATYGATMGVPIVGFTLGNYWSDHYRDRPWYRESRWWNGHAPPPMMPGWRPSPPPPRAWAPRDPAPGWQQPHQHPPRWEQRAPTVAQPRPWERPQPPVATPPTPRPAPMQAPQMPAPPRPPMPMQAPSQPQPQPPMQAAPAPVMPTPQAVPRAAERPRPDQRPPFERPQRPRENQPER